MAVAEVATDSPAAKAGVKRGDIVIKVEGTAVTSEEAFVDIVRSRSAGDGVTLSLIRQDKPVDVRATLEPPSRPLPAGKRPAILGVQVATVKDGEGVTIEQVDAGSPADRAKLKVGEVILKIDDVALTGPDKLTEVLAAKKPDDTVTLTLLLAEKTGRDEGAARRPSAVGGQRRPAAAGGGRGRGVRATGPSRSTASPSSCVEYPDAKHNPKITPKAWEDVDVQPGARTRRPASPASTVYGSMNDYYLEQSYGKLEGRGQGVRLRRGEQEAGGVRHRQPRQALLTEALDKLLARDGKDALKDFDGVFFIYAGGRFQVAARQPVLAAPLERHAQRQALAVLHLPRGRRSGWATSASSATSSATCSACPTCTPGRRTPAWRASASGARWPTRPATAGRSTSAPGRKEKLGWIKPTVIDPTVKQKLILGADRGLAEGVLQGAGPAGRQRVLPAGEPHARRASTRACRPRGC